VRGAVPCGLHQALEEMGLKASAVRATSIGAIVGGYYAAGSTSRDMKKIIDGINFKNVSKLMDISLFRNTSFIKESGSRHFRRNIPIDRFEDLVIP